MVVQEVGSITLERKETSLDETIHHHELASMLQLVLYTHAYT